MKNILYKESIVEIKQLFRIMKITVLILFYICRNSFCLEILFSDGKSYCCGR